MNKTATWKEARRLYRLGFAIHWLHSKSKRPIESGWGSGPRKKWDQLNETHDKSFNVGVRLGTPSKIDDRGYLAVIDVDIKSTEQHHRKEAVAALRKLIGKAQCPEVRSGRGNGSRHLYCLTDKPFKTWNPAESDEMIKVLMPSKSPSKRELKELTEAEIKQGYRISKAWEISLYSDGRQVVLPPSIHPDTNKPYFWTEHLSDLDSLPLLAFDIPEDSERTGGKAQKRVGPQETVEDLTIDETLDVRWLPDLSDEVRNAIVKGVGVEDRSAYLLRAAHALHSAGLDKNGILTVLTDRSTFLGECAYEHAQTSSRSRAAQWVWNYTLKAVLDERDPARVFRDVPVVSNRLDSEDAKEQAESIEDESDWRQYLEKTDKGVYRATLNNCKLIIQNTCDQKEVVGRDEFAINDFYLCDTPWRSKKGDAVTDMDIVRIKFYCAERFRIEFPDNLINQALLEIADVNRFHPVRDYMKGLEWDGTPRIETWLRDFAGASGPDDYLRAVSRKVLVAMVKRVFEPGCKFDHVLILEGVQGVGKSTLLKNLVGAQWFTDQAVVIGEKDTVLTMQSKWLIELGELSSLNRSEVEAMKAFITQTTDRIRAPYGKRVEEFPRQCIFVGSTNQDEYLKDETGNRRFWPVTVGEIDFEGVAHVRDQLFAEAYAFYLLGEPLYLETKELNQLARTEQEKRGEVDEWLGAVADVVMSDTFPRGGFEMRQLAKCLDQFNAHKLDKGDQMRLAKILKQLGFEKYQERAGARRKMWRIGTTSRLNGTTSHQVGGSHQVVDVQDFY